MFVWFDAWMLICLFNCYLLFCCFETGCFVCVVGGLIWCCVLVYECLRLVLFVIGSMFKLLCLVVLVHFFVLVYV